MTPVRTVAKSRGRVLAGRVALLLAALTFVWAVVVTPPFWYLPDARAGGRHVRCEFPWRQSTRAKVATVRCWAEERGLDVERVLPIPRCEAGPDYQDRNGSDGRAGPWQHEDDGTWDPRHVWLATKAATHKLKQGEWSRWAECL